MPITPLHFGVILPLKLIRMDKFSAASFVVANIIIDTEPVFKILFETPGDLHGFSHSYLWAVIMTLIWAGLIMKTTDPGDIRRHARIEGFAWGVSSHVLLDSFVHSEMDPLYPYLGNPFFWDGMKPVSIALFVLLSIGMVFITRPSTKHRYRVRERLEHVRFYFAGLFRVGRR